MITSGYTTPGGPGYWEAWCDGYGLWHVRIRRIVDADMRARGIVLGEIAGRERKTSESYADAYARVNNSVNVRLVSQSGQVLEYVEVIEH